MILLPSHPALRLLLRRNARASIRRQWRRMKTLKGLIMTLAGVFAVGLWLLSLVVQSFTGDEVLIDLVESRARFRLFTMALLVLALVSAVQGKGGVYMPPAETDRLFSAPVASGDRVRYRLSVNMAKSILGGSFIALMMSRHLGSPLFAGVSVILAVAYLSVLSQGAQLLAAAASPRTRRLCVGGLLALVVGLFVAFRSGGPVGQGMVEALLGSEPIVGGLDAFLEAMMHSPALVAVSSVFEPFVRMATASGWLSFGGWSLLGVCTLALSAEIVVRLPYDHRLQTLETTARMGAAIRRARTGAGAFAKVSKGAAGLNLPWFLGRGPTGAIVWMKSIGVLRRSKGAVLLGLLVILGTFGMAGLFEHHLLDDPVDQPDGVPRGAVMVPAMAFAVFYLTLFLRFDFKEELERIGAIKAWPMRPSSLFTAIVLPQFLFIAMLLLIGCLGTGVALQSPIWMVALAVATIPPMLGSWIAMDNLVFLLFPTRAAALNEGGVHGVGRNMVAFAGKFLAYQILLGLTGVSAFLFYLLLTRVADASEWAGILAGGVLAWGLMLLSTALLLVVGGWALRRFDVAQDLV